MCEPDVYSDDELDQLFENVALGEPDSFDDNDECLSQVRLFAAVGSPADEPLGGARLALAEGSKGKRRTEGGSCQRPPLITTPAA